MVAQWHGSTSIRGPILNPSRCWDTFCRTPCCTQFLHPRHPSPATIALLFTCAIRTSEPSSGRFGKFHGLRVSWAYLGSILSPGHQVDDEGAGSGRPCSNNDACLLTITGFYPIHQVTRCMRRGPGIKGHQAKKLSKSSASTHPIHSMRLECRPRKNPWHHHHPKPAGISAVKHMAVPSSRRRVTSRLGTL